MIIKALFLITVFAVGYLSGWIGYALFTADKEDGV